MYIRHIVYCNSYIYIYIYTHIMYIRYIVLHVGARAHSKDQLTTAIAAAARKKEKDEKARHIVLYHIISYHVILHYSVTLLSYSITLYCNISYLARASGVITLMALIISIITLMI